MQCAFCGHVVSKGETICPRCGGAMAQPTGELGPSSVDQLISQGTGPTMLPDAGQLMPQSAVKSASQVYTEVVPPFTGEVVPPFTGEVSLPGAPVTGQVYTSAPAPDAFIETSTEVDPPTARDPAPPGRYQSPSPSSMSSPSPMSSPAPSSSPEPINLFGPADPEAELHTVMVSKGDRQAKIETKLIEMIPAAKAPEPPDKRGLPDSRVARGVEDSMLEVKRQMYRFGRMGRLAVYSHLLVIIGAVSPWFYVPHQGYSPGVEGWGALALGISMACIGLLIWRHRPKPKARAMPVLLHLLVTAGLALFLLWRFQAVQELEPHLRPHLSVGFYLTSLGALSAFIGALLGLKHVR